MKERPILFNAAMVRAILEGRKTQTRRVVKPSAGLHVYLQDDYGYRYQASYKPGKEPVANINPGRPHTEIVLPHCPYGQPGDRLWVRETFSGPHCMEAGEGCCAVPPSKWGESSRIWYWADGNPSSGDWTRPRPSIHMPRWASRITLEITDVRVERLRDISEADAICEGIERRRDHPELWQRGPLRNDVRPTPWTGFPRLAFQALWEGINGTESWDANPWVWVVAFKTRDPLRQLSDDEE